MSNGNRRKPGFFDWRLMLGLALVIFVALVAIADVASLQYTPPR